MGITAGLLLTALMVRPCPTSPAPSVMLTRFTVCAPEFSGIVVVLLARDPSVGCWLTGTIVTGKLCWKVLTPVPVGSLFVTVIVMMAVPLVPGVGSKESVPVVLGLA